MSWFSGSSVSTVELDNKISEATSESIPNGEIELSVALEITDLIRSKKIPAKQCMRALKKRLTLVHANPNLLTSTLKLVDLCVKNSGYHFLVEIASKEFMDYLVDVLLKIHYNTADHRTRDIESKVNVGNTILGLIQEWALVFENQLQLNYVDKCYQRLVNEGYTFPSRSDSNSHQINSTFIDSEVPPDWVDNDSCMICYNAFSMINRKHHCRSCGGVFCQTHSNNFIPLVGLGIKEPVRVCDNCFAKHKGKRSSSHTHSKSRSIQRAPEEEDDELKKAIELSLQDSGVQYSRPQEAPPAPEPAPATEGEDEDEEMKAAIAASLKEFENQEKLYKQQSQPSNPFSQAQTQPQPVHPPSDLYSNILPFDSNEVQQSFNQNSQNFPQQHQQHQQPQYAQSQHLEQQKTQVEDLSQQEESQINLFITLMNSVKSDPKKRANILYDANLSELHAQVIRLKPKVNKSLRASIEKYEGFLEMNNKISTIIKLYDQYLEDKLNLAYGNHSIRQQPNRPYYQEPQPYQENISQQNTFSAPQLTGISHEGTVQQQSTGYVSQQGTGIYQQNRPSYPPAQPQASAQYAHESQPEQNRPSYAQPQPQPSGQYANDSQRIPSYPSEAPVRRQSTGYPEAPSYPQPNYPSYNQPSEPAFGTEDEDEESEPQQSQPGFSYPPPTTFNNDSSPAKLAYPVSYEGGPSPNQNQQPTSNPTQQPHPQGPTYPPVNYSPETTDNETDTERLGTSPGYPATLAYERPVSSNLIRRQSSTLPPLAVEEANARFPTIESVESNYDKQHPRNPAPYPPSTELPRLPNLPDFDNSSLEVKKFKAEPEPLIEL